MAARKVLSYEDYTIAWICTLPLEMAAAQALLDEIHHGLPQKPNDNNAYIVGSIEKHNVVIARLPFGDQGNATAQLKFSFKSVRLALIVGIGGGVPSERMDIRLGDVVVGKPGIRHGGVISIENIDAFAYAYSQQVRLLNQPPPVVLAALTKLQSLHLTRDRRVESILAEIKDRSGQNAQKFARPAQLDRLFLAGYHHVDANSRTCNSCNVKMTVQRRPRNGSAPVIHYGLIASTNRMVHDSMARDKLSEAYQVNCIETEATGVMRVLPCFVIRGISHYADSHRSHDWEGYAAAVAGAYAKELLSEMWAL
ncbi:hypothetical protein TMatcc_000491 [Talaromyces marneffei ATCC 18224]|uniref:Uncharacterized protein n=1 Tax=Talaromyces marneffei (strain ATCC 18224 / CBS 334.59 / QM 7333) TaxID=441960 RepID=B6QRR8_TALMQ|nr:uncharacterized protein EYB26_003071 [Talaromyces marneffei]EEA20510.1 conserved hypothetical protein [Talaromyces marneffei ATCC 18224]QGA15413.1 hypothetical protein EYB26_003071 [Talaromyces marneffei]